jgi:hypothetical protein
VRTVFQAFTQEFRGRSKSYVSPVARKLSQLVSRFSWLLLHDQCELRGMG